MDKTVAGVLGTLGVIAGSQAHAATVVPTTMADAMHATSYADLLRPIPNAVELLAAEPEQPARAIVHPVQYYEERVDHHHHHHHHHRRVVVRHDHHHHHNDRRVVIVSPFR